MTQSLKVGAAGTIAAPARETAGALWHPFADMAAVAGRELVLERADGVWVWDRAGTRYLDATASLWCVNAGHGRREIADAVARQLASLDTYSTFGDYANAPALELAARLAELAPMDGARVLLASGGGDGVDTAARLARQHFFAREQPQRTHLIARTSAYHGTHGWGTSLAGIEANRTGNGPAIGDVSLVAHDSVAALEDEIRRIGPERVAAFFCEPVIGAGGVHFPPPGYLEGVAAACRRHGVLLIVDAVICGFGRLGTWFGIERWGVRPDMIVFAKGVTSGYLPLGGVIASGAVAAPFWEEPGRMFRHGATYAGHPTCCAAALANLDILEHEDLVERGRELEDELAGVLCELAPHPAVAEVRAGLGLLGAVEIAPGALAERPDAVACVFAAARAAGVLVRPLGSSLAVSPPLTIGTPELALIGDALRAGLEELA